MSKEKKYKKTASKVVLPTSIVSTFIFVVWGLYLIPSVTIYMKGGVLVFKKGIFSANFLLKTPCVSGIVTLIYSAITNF